MQLTFQGKTYTSAKQAVYAELASTFQDEAGRQRIMDAESADAIQYSVKDVPGELDANEVKWNTRMTQLLYDINLIKFQQYPGTLS